MKEPIRHEQILEAALRRFAHYGVTKTTMTEIADDLSLSKQALHYYFPDKSSLTRAVISGLTGRYLESVAGGIGTGTTVIEALESLISVRAGFFRSYYQLFAQLETVLNEQTREGQELLQEVHRREIALLGDRLRQGMAKGELRPLDADGTAELLLEALSALARQLHLKCLPGLAEFEKVTERQIALAHLLYYGLRNDTWTH
ncbi:MAG: TetR/AcrR family transcriptional regulator [Chitinophagaceae bacterium]|nr:MAG: TetR/AcrR family transcriptional regulator [Chitinophagaceae bacterium]